MSAAPSAVAQLERRVALVGRLLELLVVVARAGRLDPREVLDEARGVLDRERARLVARKREGGVA